MIAFQKLLHFIFLSYTLNDVCRETDETHDALVEASQVVWDTRPMWDPDYDFHS